MPLVRLGPVALVPPGAVSQYLHGDRPVAVCNHGGEIRALDGRCPHVGGPLAQGNFVDGRLICPWHAWEFDTASGESVFNPAVRLDRYPVEIRDGEIWVDLP
jgi:nitrite reductase/ring-hydroxylating ferredoxin subunit